MSWQRTINENTWRENKENVIASFQRKINDNGANPPESFKEGEVREFWDNLSLIEKQAILTLEKGTIVEGFMNYLITIMSIHMVKLYIYNNMIERKGDI